MGKDDESVAAKGNGDLPPEAAPQVKLQLTITILQDDSLQVTGPLENEMLFDWMLKKAGESAATWRAQQVKSRIVVPEPTLLGRLKRLAPVRKR